MVPIQGVSRVLGLVQMCKGTREQYSPDIITEKNFSDACRHLLDNGDTYQTIYNYYKSLVHSLDKFKRKKIFETENQIRRSHCPKFRTGNA